jgi:RimJ/RimL family protein N-acetyltransferase
MQWFFFKRFDFQQMIRLEKCQLFHIEPLRIRYLSALHEFQDIFLEFLAADADYYLVQSEDESIGYVIIAEDNVLVEFYLSQIFQHRSLEIFSQIIHEIDISSVYCKSFDYILLNVCLSNSLSYKPIGYLFRDFHPVDIHQRAELTYRFAEASDLPFLIKQEDEVFEPKEQLPRLVQDKAIIIMQTAFAIVGCGFLTRIHPSFDYFDLGVWIDIGHRQKGYATQGMIHMIGVCRKNNWQAICGCAIDNHASKKMLRRVGFVSNHQLLEFDINP